MSFSSLLSGLVVLAFFGLTLNLTIDGKNRRYRLLKKAPHFFNNFEKDLLSQVAEILNHCNTNINTIAIIEKAWSVTLESQEWENDKRYYQSLPNLLLALGLLGTFLGITLNLFLLGRNTVGDIQLQQALSDIIGSMAIAFGSSLFALLCSIFLTKFFPSHTLDLEKDKIFSQLEDYLDNGCLPFLLAGKTLPDKVEQLTNTIDNYSQNMHNLLLQFPKTIQDLQQTSESASHLISTCTNNFQAKVIQASDTIQRGANTLDSASQNLTELTNNFSQMTATIFSSVSQLDQSTQSLEKATSSLQEYGGKLENINHNLFDSSLEIKQLIQQNRQDASNIFEMLQKNGKELNISTQKLNGHLDSLVMSLNQQTTVVKESYQDLHKFTEQFRLSEQSVKAELSKTLPALKENTLQIEKQNLNLQTFIYKTEALNMKLPSTIER